MFLHPLMLIGLGAAVVPLVLHLLSRARFRDVEWGAMLFLEGMDRRRTQTARLTQWLLLLIRMGLIAALAFALARPVLEAGVGGGTDGGSLTAVILLDCSGSMSFDENGRTRFELARQNAQEILAGLRTGDHVALIPMGNAAEADQEPTTDIRSVAARLGRMQPGRAVANVMESLERAADLLARDASHRDIYVIGDRQALSWRDLDASFAARWRKRISLAAPPAARPVKTRLLVVPVGTTDADNVAVESVSVVNPPAIRGQPAEIEVRLHNYTPVPRADLPLILRIGGRLLLQTRVNLPAQRTTTLTFEQATPDRKISFPNSGSQVLTAEISTTGYVSDDRLDSSIDVIDPIKVLVVSGDQRSGAFQSETDFIRWALAPHQTAGLGQGSDSCVLNIVPADQWNGAELELYQVVLLANIERFNARQVRALERFVYGGGRVLIAPGSLSRVDEYNAELYRDGAGILPAELQPPTSADGSDATSILGYDAAHPIFQFLRGKPDPIPGATIGRYFPAVARQSYAWPLAWYASGDPFLIEGSSERGRVLLMTTSLDADWTTLPLSNFYLPFLQNAIRYLAANLTDRNLAPGQPLQLQFPDGDPSRHVTLTGPDGHKRSIEVVRYGSQAEVRVEGTDQPGPYRLDVDEPGRPTITYFYVVSAPREESDLTQLTSERWKWLERELGARRIEPTEQPVREIASAGRSGRELWGAAIVGVIVLATLEMGVARATSGDAA